MYHLKIKKWLQNQQIPITWKVSALDIVDLKKIEILVLLPVLSSWLLMVRQYYFLN